MLLIQQEQVKKSQWGFFCLLLLLLFFLKTVPSHAHDKVLVSRVLQQGSDTTPQMVLDRPRCSSFQRSWPCCSVLIKRGSIQYWLLTDTITSGTWPPTSHTLLLSLLSSPSGNQMQMIVFFLQSVWLQWCMTLKVNNSLTSARCLCSGGWDRSLSKYATAVTCSTRVWRP